MSVTERGLTYELHPLCTLFPRLGAAEFNALRDDIKANGLRSPIVLHGGMILDGGNRYRACVEAGIEPTFAEFGGGSLVSFVLSANLHRRHMTTGQQAAIVASAQDWAQAQGRGGDGSNQHRKSKGATLPLSSVADRVAQSGASTRTQKMADKVAKADPALARKVAHGDVSLPKAHAQISPPKQTPKQAEAARNAEEAHGDFDPLAALEAAQAEIHRLTEELKAAEADDLKAEAIKWRRIAEQAQRRQGELMDSVNRLEGECQKFANRWTRLGKVIGQTDPTRIAAAVEALARNKVAA